MFYSLHTVIHDIGSSLSVSSVVLYKARFPASRYIYTSKKIEDEAICRAIVIQCSWEDDTLQQLLCVSLLIHSQFHILRLLREVSDLISEILRKQITWLFHNSIMPELWKDDANSCSSLLSGKEKQPMAPLCLCMSVWRRY